VKESLQYNTYCRLPSFADFIGCRMLYLYFIKFPLYKECNLAEVSDIKEKIDLVEYVLRHVPLQKSGQNFKANCPFHQEKTPSFYVFPDKQTWRCFGACADGGDVFNFVMKSQNLEFSDALSQLADETGIILRVRNVEETQKKETSKSINQASYEFFCECLQSSSGSKALEYLANRDVDQDTIKSFGIGYSLSDNKSLIQKLRQIGYQDDDMITAGICRRNDDGSMSEVFRGRLMIPIRIRNGDVVGFGARTLEDRQPKYLNSPQTDIFDKSKILYGIDKSFQSIKKEGTIVIVEGYMDVIRAHKHGYTNVVASMGTALTRNQVEQIKVMADNVVMGLDSDAAGQQATLRNLDSAWKVFQMDKLSVKRTTRDIFRASKNPVIKIALMPHGEDPDDVIRRSTAEWDSILENAKPMFLYLLESLGEMYGTETPNAKNQLVEALGPIIYSVSNPIEQDQYVESLRQYLNIRESTLLAALRNIKPAQKTYSSGVSYDSKNNNQQNEYVVNDPLEAFCLKMIAGLQLQEEEYVAVKEEYFTTPENKTLLNMVKTHRVNELEQLDSSNLTNAWEYVQNQKIPPMNLSEQKEALEQAIRRLEDRYLKNIKSEEGLRFVDESFEVLYSESNSILTTNERIKYNQRSKLKKQI
jgi:DNA primase